ncbi:hypothetical protein M2459_002407 [Parabacteroides sp. PF5-5]|uniref:fimbrial protein n=1 Tax=unclassified Parabacteroides TaxID=2649774 RepID=UPI002476BFC1|nr:MULTISPECIES: fimbrial protein [unclassified Parabacteroides]MDH6305307.1 hypothetical protein [Parabacteroides sp. PH5-39]MDH6316660.1 hypothetical protein [Parabacteroides sp. PF5-13]MDH6320160.1 hypothetical protein [Parabacteroides sp. PH5-13]MDH6323897.1 hypothetical protein [Parabacteroides sp. PH5-8]MDH6327837.1 hypothetical protein [Parabacteroides sp. PH5-41]
MVKKTIFQTYSAHNIFLWFILCVFAISCSTEEMLNPPSVVAGDGENMSLKLTINTPPTVLPKGATKSQTAEEASINEIRILVFRNDTYIYSAEGSILDHTATSTTFDAELKTSSSPIVLFLLANSNQAIDAANIAAGDSKSEVKAKIQHAFTVSGISSPFPMFGEYELPSLDTFNNNEISGIKMLRSVARADILVADDVTNFEMVSVQLYRANNKMQIIPNNMTDAAVTSPSIPGNSSGSIITSEISVSGNVSQSQLYVPESSAPDESEKDSKATCIIVGGKYANGEVTYYRIDFNLGMSGHPFGQILRNHKYIFNILKVGMPGKKTPEEAAKAPSVGIISEVQTWDENSTDMYFDGEHYIGVSARTVLLKSWAGSTSEISVNTDVSDYTIQWSDENGNLLGVASETSIQNTNYLVQLRENKTLIHVEALTRNGNHGERNDYFTIQAGQWKVVIKIAQLGYAATLEEVVRVLSFTNVGDLGTGYSSDGTLNASGAAMRQILNYYFYPASLIDMGGYSFNEMAQTVISGSNTLAANIMADYDVMFYTYDSKPSTGTIVNTLQWLNNKKNRVLIVAADWTGTNINLLSALGDTWDWIYKDDGGNFKFVEPTEANSIFTQTGPFGGVSSSSVFGRTDAYWGRTLNYSEYVIPLLTSSYDGGMVLGVNKKRRIVYIGDCNLFTTTGANYLTGAGNLSKDQDYLMGNLWAWITDVVLSGR